MKDRASILFAKRKDAQRLHDNLLASDQPSQLSPSNSGLRWEVSSPWIYRNQKNLFVHHKETQH